MSKVDKFDYDLVVEQLQSLVAENRQMCNVEIPRPLLKRLNIYMKENNLKNRKRLMEILVIKFITENTKEVKIEKAI